MAVPVRVAFEAQEPWIEKEVSDRIAIITEGKIQTILHSPQNLLF